MKLKKFCTYSLFLIFGLVASFCFMPFVSQQKSAQATNNAESFYFIKGDDDFYISETRAGSTSGYGSYVLGNTATLTATANDGFTIVGWALEYNDGISDHTKLIKLGTDPTNIEIEKDSETRNVLISVGGSEDANGRVSTAGITVDEVFEDLTINPVFDYLYYKVQIDFAKYTNLHNSLELDANNTLYYDEETSTEIGGFAYTKYTNSYLTNNSKSYYLGDVCEKDNQLFTTHTNTDIRSREIFLDSMEFVEISRGAFRLNDGVNIAYSVGASSDYLTNNIDILYFNLTVGTTTSTIENSNVSISRDEYKRSTAYSVAFNIQNIANRINKVEMHYHDLYNVRLSFTEDNVPFEQYTITTYENVLIAGEPKTVYQIDDTYYTLETNNLGNQYISIIRDVSQLNLTSGVESSYSDDFTILCKITTQNQFSKINSAMYLVKNSKDNGGQVFSVSFPSAIGEQISGVGYTYYSLEGSRTITFDNLKSNVTQTTNYFASRFIVDFKFVLYEDNQIIEAPIPEDFVCPDAVSLKRKQSVGTAYVLENLENPIGYKFKGFSFGLGTIEPELNFSYKVNVLEPKGTTVYLCFSKIEYKIKINNVDNFSLYVRDGENYTPTHPIKTLLLAYTQNGTPTKSTTNGQYVIENAVEHAFTLSQKFKIGESFQLTTDGNLGFSIEGLFLIDENEEDRISASDVTLDKDLLERFANENDEIEFELLCDYLRYSITYTVNTLTDDNQPIFLADIEANVVTRFEGDTNDASVAYFDLDDQEVTSNEDGIVKIVVSNLKYYEVVELSSKGKVVNLDNPSVIYVFNYFTQDGISTLTYTQDELDEDKYIYTETVLRDRSIYVVYSTPTVKINVLLNKAGVGALDFVADSFQVINTANQEEFEAIVADGNIYYEAEMNTQIKFIIVGDIHFGYELDLFALTTNGASSNGISSILAEKYCTFTASGIQNLTINFNILSYKFHILQFGAGKNNDELIFDLSVDNTLISFEKPVGYFVSEVYVVNQDGTLYSGTEIPVSIAEDGKQFGTTYSKILDAELFANLVQNYSVQIDEVVNVYLHCDYDIYKFTVRISLSIEKDAQEYPQFSATCTYNSENTVLTPAYSNKVYTFVNLPYGSTVQLKADSIPKFLTSNGWRTESGDLIELDDHFTFINNNNLTIADIETTYDLVYSLSFISYNLILDYDAVKGSPDVYKNNAKVQGEIKLVQYDTLEIHANAIRTNGYTFERFEYLDENGDVVSYQNSKLSFEFDVNNFTVSSSNLTIRIVYSALEITIINISHSVDKLDKSYSVENKGTGEARINVQNTELATYEILKKPANSSIFSVIDEAGTITSGDTIQIHICINKSALESVSNIRYDLTRGLELYNIELAGRVTYVPSNDPNSKFYKIPNKPGEYILKITLLDVVTDGGARLIDLIQDEGEYKDQLRIDYNYKILEKTLTATTNIESDDFYSNVNLYIRNDYTFTGNGEFVNAGQNEVKFTTQYLAKAIASYDLGGIKNYFKVSSVAVIVDGKILNQEELEKFDIQVVEDDDKIYVKARFVDNVLIEFILTPILYFNGEEATDGYQFTKTFKCDVNGQPDLQVLTTGYNTATSIFDISAYQGILNCLTIDYKLTGTYVSGATQVGIYDVVLTFKNSTEFNYMKQVKAPMNITLKINPKTVYLKTIDNLPVFEREYNGFGSAYDYKLMDYLVVTDNLNFNISYNNFSKKESYLSIKTDFDISTQTDENDTGTIQKNARENPYDLYVRNLALVSAEINNYNKNFVLDTSSLVLTGVYKITQRIVTVSGVDAYSKVFDGNTHSKINPNSTPTIINKITGDDVQIDLSKVVAEFDNLAVSGVKGDRDIVLDFSSALTGPASSNYKIVSTVTLNNKTIYPYEIQAQIGNNVVVLRNEQGLVDSTKADLLPVGSSLEVKMFKTNSPEFTRNYKRFADFLNNTTSFSVGYEIIYKVNNKDAEINPGLQLYIPKTDNMKDIVYLNGESSGRLNYTKTSEGVLIDLSTLNEDIEMIIVMERTSYFKPWQIALIVASGITLIGTGVTTFVVIRRRKLKRYIFNEKL